MYFQDNRGFALHDKPLARAYMPAVQYAYVFAEYCFMLKFYFDTNFNACVVLLNIYINIIHAQ